MALKNSAPLHFRPNLIFDVGMHVGQDTAFYLAKGFTVVAVDANPALCDEMRDRFGDAIANRKLFIENLCIGNRNDQVDFYINEKVTEWSSIHQSLGQRGLEGSAAQITIEMKTLDVLFGKYGVPYYLKIDVEGADGIAVQGLWNCSIKPLYVSFEASHLDGLCHLFCQGYRDFKLVNQKHFLDYSLPNPPHEGAFVEHTFLEGSTGPFGEETMGAWSTLEEVVTDFVKFRQFDADDRRSPSSWIDIHARHASTHNKIHSKKDKV